MELTMNKDFLTYKFLKGTTQTNHKLNQYLHELAEEADNLARVWEAVVETVMANGRAVASANAAWSKLIERPEWSIYSSDLPKSRLELLFNQLSEGLMYKESQSAYFVHHIGLILQKKELTADDIERELRRAERIVFFNKHNRVHDDISIQESIIIMNSEVAAIRTLARNFRISSAEPSNRTKKSTKKNFSRMFFLKKISTEEMLNEFRDKYKNASGLAVDLDFLKSRSVYAAFNMSNRMCGGFVLGSHTPLRTIEVFASEQSRPELYRFVEKTTCCEVNCFWLTVKSRSGFSSYWFWILFAFQVFMQKEKIVIYGTIARSLANIYGYPSKSKLLHTEEMMFDGRVRTSWIFTCARTYFLRGVLETFIYKFKNNGKRPVVYRRIYS